MKILFSSYVFSPQVGGIETVSALLATEFIRAGYEVKLVTSNPNEDGLDWPFAVVRNPSPAQLIDLMRWCDLFFQNNVSLELAWPLLFVRRPWVITHQSWLDHEAEPLGWKPALKKHLLRYARNVSISRAVAHSLPLPSTVIGNPFSPEIFRSHPEITRDRELVYLGRLVSDKGIDLLIEALADLRKRNLQPHLTVIGSGPELAGLQARTRELGLEKQVEFLGSRNGTELAQILNAHQLMVIPSRWQEPFGIVALEGIACGCVVVASQSGGLPEAVGPCGLLFDSGNVTALADTLHQLLTIPSLRAQMQLAAPAHLQNFSPSVIAHYYLDLFQQVLGKTII